MTLLSRPVPAIAALIAALLAFPTHATEVVNVYSYRQPFLIKPMFDAFTRETGIAVNVVYAKKGWLERLSHEGANSPADLIFTVDIGRLTDAVNAGVTQAVESRPRNQHSRPSIGIPTTSGSASRRGRASWSRPKSGSSPERFQPTKTSRIQNGRAGFAHAAPRTPTWWH